MQAETAVAEGEGRNKERCRERQQWQWGRDAVLGTRSQVRQPVTGREGAPGNDSHYSSTLLGKETKNTWGGRFQS